MKTRIPALLIMLAAMALLSACSAGTHSDTGVFGKAETTASFSESKEPESTINPESSKEASQASTDAEESDTSIQASTASESRSRKLFVQSN